MSLCVPKGHLHVSPLSSQLKEPAALQSLVNNIDAEWAFQGPCIFGLDSLLLLQRYDENSPGSNPVVAICIQSKKLQGQSNLSVTLKAAASSSGWFRPEEAAKMLNVPGVQNLMLYVIDKHRTILLQSWC